MTGVRRCTTSVAFAVRVWVAGVADDLRARKSVLEFVVPVLPGDPANGRVAAARLAGEQ